MDQPRSRIGFHYKPPVQDYSESTRDQWIAQLRALDAGWLYLPVSTEQALPEGFVKGLLEAGIEPVLHVSCTLGSLRPAELNPLLYSYAHWGVEYIVIYDRPNQKSQWAGNSWTRRGLVDRFLDTMLPTLQAQHGSGLRPVLPPLQPGGDYWDTAFLESALKGLARRGQRELLDSLTLTAYAWSDGRPLDWGAGGPDAWPQSQPYHTPQGAQDQRGFRIFEWYEALTERILGSSLPILAVAGGARGEADGSGAINANIAKLLRDPDNAQSLMAICFEAMPREADRDAWFVDERQEKASASAAAKVVSATGSAKTFAHYLLLPTEESQAVPAWRKASAFALTHRPVVGFSPTEAALAEQVTIAAGPDVIPDDIEETLRAAGCRVQRLSFLPTRKSACRCKAPDNMNGPKDFLPHGGATDATQS